MTWKAALPMYNVSLEMRDSYEALLETLIDILRAGGWRESVELVRDPQLPAFWHHPDMLLSQTCGYPYVTQLQGRVRLIATPCYGFPGCSGMDYASAIVVREEGRIKTLSDAKGGIAAVNNIDSNSGMNVLRHAVAPQAHDGRFFSEVKLSGSHQASLAMVRNGEADIAAIDCVTFAYARQENPEWVAGLSILQYSAVSPGLPLIAAQILPEELLIQVRSALLEPAGPMSVLLRRLHIDAWEPCTDTDYARVMHLENEALTYAYPILR